MDLKAFLLSEEFKEYHRLQAQAVAECLHGLLMSAGLRPDIKPAMDMAHKLHQMPLAMYEEKEFQDVLRARLKINAAAMTVHFSKKVLDG